MNHQMVKPLALRLLAGACCCPKCRSSLMIASATNVLDLRCSNASCRYSRSPFPVIHGTPCLIDFERSIVQEAKYQRPPPNLISPLRRMARRLAALSEGPPLSTRAACKRFLAEAKAINPRPRVLVIGGGTIGIGAEDLHTDPNIELIVTDVFVSDIVSIACDGHFLPFRDETFDGVWIQAVLEHVLSPTEVAAEIWRVLATQGIVYAGTPFMHQVHMGAFDFQRFTLSGHRWLFKSFTEIDAGPTNGAGRALVWSLAYFSRALLRSDRLWLPLRIAFGWLGRLDPLMDKRRNEDAASGSYFIGRKSSTSLIPADIVKFYEQRDR